MIQASAASSPAGPHVHEPYTKLTSLSRQRVRRLGRVLQRRRTVLTVERRLRMQYGLSAGTADLSTCESPHSTSDGQASGPAVLRNTSVAVESTTPGGAPLNQSVQRTRRPVLSPRH